MESKRYFYFAYGMNTDPEAMIQRTGNPTAIGRARLDGYRFRFAFHADVVANENSAVDGVLWDISEDHLRALDAREGYPYYYDRKTVPVECQGRIYDAVVYFMRAGEPLNPPSQHYWEMLERGYTTFAVPMTQMYRAYAESQKAPQKDIEAVKFERNQRAWDRIDDYVNIDAVLYSDAKIEDKSSKFFGRDIHSLTDAEWREYEAEWYDSPADTYYKSLDGKLHWC